MTATNAVPVDSSNIEQLRAWDGNEGEYWADNAEYFDRSVTVYHERLLAVAAIRERDHVLDVGCGTGRPLGTQPAPPRLAPRSGSTFRHACSTTPAAAPPRTA